MTTRAEQPDDAVTLTGWAAFLVMSLGMFMAILDIQVVTTSLPTIQRALGLRADQMSWVQTAYLIAEVVAIPLTGFATRAFSLRWLFTGSVTLFTAASVGCALTHGFADLIAWRVLQGFAGGVMIPAVFSAALTLFPFRWQGLATTIGGVAAVMAPTVGPIVGGWITQTYSWHWLFLINLAPGLVCALSLPFLLPREPAALSLLRRLDIVATVLLAICLAALVIGLKAAPDKGWLSLQVLGEFALSAVAASLFVRQCLRARTPLVDLRALRSPGFVLGCGLSFLFGAALFSSTYLMPVFLGLVREHGPLRIGEIMVVTGLAQLASSPVAVWLERRIGPRTMAAGGFALFAVGLAMSARQTPDTDYAAMLWPQIVRGSAIMFCLLPGARLALGALPAAEVPNASGLFNLTRNLGGAIGLALADTVIFDRLRAHGRHIADRLQAGDYAMAQTVGIPSELFAWRPAGPLSPEMTAQIEPMVRRLALTWSINEAWMLLAAFSTAALAITLASFVLAPCRPAAATS